MHSLIHDLGLMALLNPDRINWLYAFSAMFGMGTAVTTVIPSKILFLYHPKAPEYN